MRNKISLAGDLGSGKSTVADLLVSMLGATRYSTGMLVRSIGESLGMGVAELNVYMETHPEIDRQIDDGLIALGSREDPLVIDSRMAWHFTPNTFRVYLSVDLETAAARIMNANRSGEHAATLEDTVAQTAGRRASEKKRYREKYGVDIMDLSNYDFVIDTTYISAAEAAAAIYEAYTAWQSGAPYVHVYLCPERISYDSDAADAAEVSRLVAILEQQGQIPPVEAAEKDGEFYLLSGNASALAYALQMSPFVPVVLVPYRETGRTFVKMKNSL